MYSTAARFETERLGASDCAWTSNEASPRAIPAATRILSLIANIPFPSFLPRHIAMQRFRLVAGFLQPLAHFLGHHYAAVLAAGAPKAHGEVAFPLMHVVGQQVKHQFSYPLQKLPALREPAHIRGHLGVNPGEFAELRHKMRIGQEPHVEDHVRIQRYAVLESKTQTGDQQLLGLVLMPKPRLDVSAQF